MGFLSFCLISRPINSELNEKVVKTAMNYEHFEDFAVSFLDEPVVAMEVSTADLTAIMKGRKGLFNTFYERIVHGLRRNDRVLMQAIAQYRDRNVDILSSPYLIDYSKFNADDAGPVYAATGIEEDEMEAAVKELKQYIKDNCVAAGFAPPEFANATPLRMLLILVMRYYMERGDKKKLQEVCAYFAYSMFYTIYYNYFRNMKIREQTMIYVYTNMSSKFKIKQMGTVDATLTTAVMQCTDTYRMRIMGAMDQDIIYVIAQMKSRIRDFIKNIKNAYVQADRNKDLVLVSKPIINTTSEDGDDAITVDAPSTTGDVERLALQYTNYFFQKPVDSQLVSVAARVCQSNRNELFSAITAMKSDSTLVPEIMKFHRAVFYFYIVSLGNKPNTIKSKTFIAASDTIYRKGNSKDENVADVKDLINGWIERVSPSFREASARGTLNNFRRSIFQYFVLTIIMR